MLTNWITKITEKIKSNWIILIYIYLTLLVTIYLGLWTAIQALNITVDTSKYKKVLLSQQFIQILITLIIASIFSLIILIIVLKKLTKRLDTFKYNNSNKRKLLIIAGNAIAIKLIDVATTLGHEVVAIYDKNPNADGVLYARSKGIHTYSHSPDELRKMLKTAQSDQAEFYFIFIPTEYANYLTRADEIIRSLRRHTKNIRFYRLGIDFDETVNEVEIASLLN